MFRKIYAIAQNIGIDSNLCEGKALVVYNILKDTWDDKTPENACPLIGEFVKQVLMIPN